MTTFAYTALDTAGKKKTGYIEAATKEAAIATITADGRFVVDIREQALQREINLGGNKKVTKSDVALFTRRLSDLSAAGLPLDRAIQVVAEQSESEALSLIAEQALEDVRGGLSVSQALGKHPKVFSEIYTQSLRAGEASGQFPAVSGRLADVLESEVARRSQIISALTYPIVLTFVAIGVVLFLLLYVVPKLSGVFESLGNDLPAPTVLLLAFTTFLTKQWYIVIGLIVGIVVSYRLWAATESGALTRDKLILRIPILGTVIRKAVVSRFARVLSTLVFGGVPILESLSIAGQSAGNRVFKESSNQVADDVRDGRSIAESMRNSGTFPPVITHMVAIGEETGDLPKMLGRVADSLDFEVDNGMRRLTALVEPLIVLAMGGFVGFVVLAVLLPIVAAQDLVK